MLMKIIDVIGVAVVTGERRDANGERMVIEMNDVGGSRYPAT